MSDMLHDPTLFERMQRHLRYTSSSGSNTGKNERDIAFDHNLFRTHFNPHQNWKWLHVTRQGETSFIPADKTRLVLELNIPYRDLRILDPKVTSYYPTAIFIREQALVVNLESIRMVIAKDQVFLMGIPASDKSAAEVGPPVEDSTFVIDLINRITQDDGSLRRQSLNLQIDTDLPFELRALESALAAVVKALEREVYSLERTAITALDSLALKVTKAELETAHNVKMTLNRLLARTGKFKQVLEDLLDDDQDMEDMYLSQRDTLHQQRTQELAHLGSAVGPGLGNFHSMPRAPDGGVPGSDEPPIAHQPSSLYRQGTVLAQMVLQRNIESCEALLEAYFMQVDFCWSRLSVLKERIDSTESLITIELDSRRNELVSLDLYITVVTLAFTFVAMVSGIFGMNLFFPWVETKAWVFVLVTVMASMTALCMTASIFAYARMKRLLFIPNPTITAALA